MKKFLERLIILKKVHDGGELLNRKILKNIEI
jgi:hypothetical protein